MRSRWWAAVTVAGALAVTAAGCGGGRAPAEGSGANPLPGTGTAVQQPAGMNGAGTGAAMNPGPAQAAAGAPAKATSGTQPAGAKAAAPPAAARSGTQPAAATAGAQPANAHAAAQMQVKFDRAGNGFVVTNQSQQNWTQVRIDVDGFTYTLPALNAGKSQTIAADQFRNADGKAYVPAAAGFKKVSITADAQGKKLTWQSTGTSR